ncbi:beta-defensin 119 isoform X1 [Bubalus kerabau]|uniref:Beta-defensin 119 n=1 Tax=Bubalus bubalis TaxID=89462 RepID=A0A1W6S9V6_BUBBU|nr:beta-defensin 119 isoform X1 [Bubalus bubalis]XP_055399182.1 beta-defensin 119 isoform X1 [Bubalus carabanensis]ARO77467.1 beta-defensin 119 [Bubalus bubalis]
MKFLFLFLAILLVMEPVVSGRRHMLRCMGDLGICRPSCRQSEEPYLYCRNYQPCCLPFFVRIDISGKEGKNDWSRENRWPKVS